MSADDRAREVLAQVAGCRPNGKETTLMVSVEIGVAAMLAYAAEREAAVREECAATVSDYPISEHMHANNAVVANVCSNLVAAIRSQGNDGRKG